MVQSEFQDLWFLAVLGFFVCGLFLGSLFESLLLVLFGFWAVLGQQLEKVVRLVFFQGGSELVDLGWDLKSVQQNSLLSL